MRLERSVLPEHRYVGEVTLRCLVGGDSARWVDGRRFEAARSLELEPDRLTGPADLSHHDAPSILKVEFGLDVLVTQGGERGIA